MTKTIVAFSFIIAFVSIGLISTRVVKNPGNGFNYGFLAVCLLPLSFGFVGLFQAKHVIKKCLKKDYKPATIKDSERLKISIEYYGIKYSKDKFDAEI